MLASKRILSVTLGRKPMMCFSGFKAGMLHIVRSEVLPSDFIEMQKVLLPEIEQARSKDYEILIEDPTGYFREYAPVITLSDQAVMGGTIMAKAMDNLIAMQHRGAITFPAGQEGHYTINDSILNEKTNDQGSRIYQIDWKNITPYNRLMIITVYAAVNNDPTRQSFIKQFYNHLTHAVEVQDDTRSIPVKIIDGIANAASFGRYAKPKPVSKGNQRIISKEIDL